MTTIALPPLELRQILSRRRLAALLHVPLDVLVRLARNADRLYHPFETTVTKNGFKKKRLIDNPDPELKRLQRRILNELLAKVDMPAEFFGGRKGKSVGENARIHVRQPQVVTIDLKDFFPRVSNSMVASIFRRTFGCSADVCWLLTRLTTRCGHLPQGAPTSTALAGLALVPASTEIASLCETANLRHSVWVDDITISGPHAANVLPGAISALKRHHFRISRPKLHVMGRHQHQEVTRHVVNDKVSLGRNRLSAIRREIHRLDGPLANPARVRGLLAFAQSSSPDQALVLRKALDRRPSTGTNRQVKR